MKVISTVGFMLTLLLTVVGIFSWIGAPFPLAHASVLGDLTSVPKSSASPIPPYWERYAGKISPNMKIGYQRIGADLEMPIPFEFSVRQTSAYKGSSTILRMRDANILLGEAGLQATVSPNARVFLNGSASLFHTFTISLIREISNPFEMAEWERHHLEWYQLEFGFAYNFRGPFSVRIGTRWEHFGILLEGPSSLAPTDPARVTDLRLTGCNVRCRFWVPFAGLGFASKNFGFHVIGSPLAASEINVGTVLQGKVLPNQTLIGHAKIKLAERGAILEASADYTTDMFKLAKLTGWCKGGLIFAQGQGHIDTSIQSDSQDLRLEPLTGEHLRFFRYNLGGGIAISAQF